MPISALPTPPTREDPANFRTRADLFLAALPTFTAEANALETNVNAKEASSASSASSASGSATTASNAASSATASASAASASAATATAQAAAASASAASVGFTVTDLQTQSKISATTTGTSTAYAATPSPAVTNAAKTRLRLTFHTPPGANPTLAVSGQTALPLKYKDSAGTKQAITTTQVPSNWAADVESDGTDWVVLDIASHPTGSGSGLDADKLDGQEGSYYSPATHNHAGVYVPVDANLGVGCHALMMVKTTGVTSQSSTAGSNLYVVKYAEGSFTGSVSPSGTWRNLYNGTISANEVGLFQRIA